MRVLALIDCDGDPVYEELVWRRVCGLARADAEVVVLAMRSSPTLLSRFARLDIPVHLTSDAPAPDWAAVRDLAVVLRDAGAQVIYCHGEAAHARAALAGPFTHVPVVAHLLDDFRLTDAHAIALCRSLVVVATEHARMHAVSAGSQNVEVVATPPGEEGAPHPAAREHDIVGWGGVLADRSNAALFVRAASAVRHAHPEVRFRMMVSDPDAARRLVRRHAPDSADAIAVEHLEFETQAPLSEIDVLVTTEWRDACHLLTVDALAHGIRVIGSAVSGRGEYLLSKNQGWLYRPGDERQLVATINEAVDGDRELPPAAAAVPPPSIAEAGAAMRQILQRAI